LTALDPGARVAQWLVATLGYSVSVKADWGIQALEEAGGDTADGSGQKSDPFSAASLASMNLAPADWMFDVGLESPVEELQRLLGLTVRSQNRMFNAGVDCHLRWRSDVSCLACPLSDAENPESPKHFLCRCSMQEERLETILAAKAVGV
jgi:hypothetical protein